MLYYIVCNTYYVLFGVLVYGVIVCWLVCPLCVSIVYVWGEGAPQDTLLGALC